MNVAPLAVVLEAARWGIGPLLLWRLPVLPTAEPAADLAVPAVAVVIPARDEERSIGALLTSLLEQRPGCAEIIVVDDHSADATGTIARAAGVPVLVAPELPHGWTGKAHACAHGAAATTAPCLVFLDADVHLADRTVIGRLAARVASNPGGLVTVQPTHVTGRLTEAGNAFFVLASLMGTNAFTVVGSRVQPRGAFGPCVASARAAYDAVGGHAHDAVRGSVVDDVALAAAYRAKGRRVDAFGGARDVTYRLYPHGLRALVNGWTKNIAAGAESTHAAILLLVVIWLSGCITAGVRVVADPSWVAAATYAAYAGAIAWLLHNTGRFPRGTALLYPLSLALFLAVFVRAALKRALGRPVEWKARPVGGRR